MNLCRCSPQTLSRVALRVRYRQKAFHPQRPSCPGSAGLTQFDRWKKIRTLPVLNPRVRTSPGYSPELIAAQLFYCFLFGRHQPGRCRTALPRAAGAPIGLCAAFRRSNSAPRRSPQTKRRLPRRPLANHPIVSHAVFRFEFHGTGERTEFHPDLFVACG